MTPAGVLGLGRMGGPIARRLGAAGFDVISFDPLVDGPGVTAVAGEMLVAKLLELKAGMRLRETDLHEG